MKCRIKLSLLLLAFSLVMLPVGSGTEKVFASPKKPKVIRLAYLGDNSGPYAPQTAACLASFMDAIQYINEEKGGIKGVRVEPVIRDSGGKLDVSISHYMEIREMKPKPLFLMGSVSGEGEALRERLAEDEIPAMWVTGTPAIYPAAYTFGLYPLYQDMFGLFVDWLAETWKGPGHPKVAFLTWDSTFGRAVLTDEAHAYAKKKGVEIVATELFGLRDVDVTTQLVRIRSKGADWIYTNTAGNGPPSIMRCAHDMGYKINLAGCGPGMEWGAIRIGGKFMEGAVPIMPFASWDEADHPGVKVMAKYFKMNKRDPAYRTVMYPLSFPFVLTAADAISRAVDEVGWEKLDGKAVKAQVEKLRDFAPLGITYWTFTPTRRTPSKAYIGMMKDGKIQPVTGWRECPDLRPAKYK